MIFISTLWEALTLSVVPLHSKMIGWFQNGFHEKDRFEVRFFSIHYFAEKEELDDECYYPRRHLRNTQLPFESSRFIFEFILSHYYFPWLGGRYLFETSTKLFWMDFLRGMPACLWSQSSNYL